MTDSQLIALAITVLAIVAGTLINNSRISDINHRIADSKEVLRAEMQAMEARLNAKLDEILRIVGDHETRIAALEQRGR